MSVYKSNPLKLIKIISFLSLFFYSYFAWGAIETLSFPNEQQEETYKTLIEELRCLVCQNNNLADSNADLAKDLRRKTYNMVIAGKSRDEVVDFMVQRYGDFVLYKPRFKGLKIFLWILPFVVLLIGLMLLVKFVRQPAPQDLTYSKQDEQRAKDLLAEEKS